MKKILLLFSVVFVASSARSQSDASVMLIPNVSVVPYTAGSSSDHSFLATLPGGENIIATNVAELGTSYINIKRINLDGTVTTLRNIPTIEPILGVTCSGTSSFSCFFGSGSTFNLMKFSLSGSVIWQKSVTIGESIMPYYNHTINETAAGEYYLTISNYGYTGLVKLDASGNVMWSHKMTGPRDTGKCPGFCSAVTPTGGVITTMKDENYETIICLDNNGALEWSRSFGDMTYRWPRSIKTDNLGNYYILGTYGSYGASYIHKLDANGNLMYAKDLSSSVAFVDAYVNAANELFILSEAPSFQLAKVGAAGNILWSRGIGAIGTPVGYVAPTYFTATQHLSGLNIRAAVNDTTDVVFKFSGAPSELCNSFNYTIPNVSDDNQVFDAAVDSTCKINPLAVTSANTGFGTTTTEYFSNNDFCAYIASVNDAVQTVDLNVYPNPATNGITIELGSIRNAAGVMLMIYDATGRKVHEAKPDNSIQMQISTADFAPGLYTLVISDANNMLGKQRVVIQR